MRRCIAVSASRPAPSGLPADPAPFHSASLALVEAAEELRPLAWGGRGQAEAVGGLPPVQVHTSGPADGHLTSVPFSPQRRSSHRSHDEAAAKRGDLEWRVYKATPSKQRGAHGQRSALDVECNGVLC